MNKKIVEALNNYNFSFEKNQGYGYIEGYEVNIVNNPTQYGPIFYFSTFLSQSKKTDFICKFNSLKISLCQAGSFDFGVCVMVGALTAGGFGKKLNEVLPKILEILQELEAPKGNICPQTNEELIEENYQNVLLGSNVIKIKMSSKGIEAVLSYNEKSKEDYKAAPNNYLKGFLGILIGAIAGGAVTVILELIGFISWLSPFVSIFLGTFLYRKFGGKPTLVMLLMSFLTTLIVILGTLFVLYLVVCTKACNDASFAVEGIEAIKFCIDNVEGVKSAIISDFVVNIVIIVLYELFSIPAVLKQVRRV